MISYAPPPSATVIEQRLFNPYLPPDRACWYCQFFARMTAQGTAALCTHANAPRVRATRDHGCSGFVREPGSDDEAITRAFFVP